MKKVGGSTSIVTEAQGSALPDPVTSEALIALVSSVAPDTLAPDTVKAVRLAGFLASTSPSMESIYSQALEVERIIASPPRPYPGAYHRAITEMRESHGETIKEARRRLGSSLVVLENALYPLPGVRQLLNQCDLAFTLYFGRAATLSAAASANLASRVDKASVALTSHVVSQLNSLGRPDQSGVFESSLSAYRLACELSYSAASNLPQRALAVLEAERHSAHRALIEAISDLALGADRAAMPFLVPTSQE